MQHRNMPKKCCNAACGEYCGGVMSKWCNKESSKIDGCCGGEIEPNDPTAIHKNYCDPASENSKQAPCKLKSKNYHLFHYFVKFLKIFFYLLGLHIFNMT